MMDINLVRPTLNHAESVWGYKQTFASGKAHIPGTADLGLASSYAEWLKADDLRTSEDQLSYGRVPSTVFLAIRRIDDRLVGMVDIRHYLNDFLLQEGGHIGYSVLPDERGKGYATEMLRQSLVYCRQLGILRVLMTCDASNVASARVIIKNGGVLENEVQANDILRQRYWIEL